LEVEKEAGDERVARAALAVGRQVAVGAKVVTGETAVEVPPQQVR
tara:strand:- start:2391 stop:2525 length:135 start_codon:yes stop_codon:yes gene_type:complete